MERATNIPASVPPLIGREQAIASSMAELSRTRLLTFIGPGGTGKSSLALEIGQRLTQPTQSPDVPYDNGIWWIDLGAVQDGELLPTLVLSALDVHEASRPEASHADIMLTYLMERHVLLLLDNCEHLLPVCTQWVELLLRSCPHVRILATSREALRSPFEQVWPVDPLSVPEMGANLDLEQVSGYSAIQLFVERASKVSPPFEIGPRNLCSIIEICRSLDGLPLAIELAAACTRFLSPQQIAQQLVHGFTLLTHGYGTAATHQRSLEATMAWSYTLLHPPEQKLFRALSAVADTFDLELACALDTESSGMPTRNLQALIDKSLISVVKRDEQPVRYRMLGMLKHYGRSQLAQCGEESSTFLRYCAWITQLVQDALLSLESSEQATWFDRLEDNLGHIRSALGWMIEHDRVVPALKVSSSLVAFWRQRGYLAEGQRWIETALAASATQKSTEVAGHYATALNALGVLYMWQGTYLKAQALHKRALAIWRQLDDKAALAATWFRLGFLADRRGNYTRARVCFDRAARLYIEQGDDHGVQRVRNRLAIIAWKEKRYLEANTLLLESLQGQRSRGHIGSCAATLLNLGALAIEEGNFEQGTAYLEESLSLNRRLGDRLPTAHALVYLGIAATYQYGCQKARQYYLEAFLAAKALDSLGGVVDPELQFRLIDGIGTTAARYGRALPAAKLWGAMERLRANYGLSYRPLERHKYEQEVACVHANVENEAFLQAWAEGRCLTHEAVMTLAGEALSTLPSLVSAQDRGLPVCLTTPVDAWNSHPALRISGLGPLQIYAGGRRITTGDMVYAKGQELLFYLLSYPRRTKAQIALALWPDATPEYVQRTFRVILYHLRRALCGSEWIEREGPSYLFNRRLQYWYDAEAFGALIHLASQQCTQNPEQAIASLEAARGLYQGDFWEGLALSDWIVQQQESLRHLHLEALLLLGDLYLTAQKAQCALAVYLDAVDRELYCEAAHRGAIRCYLALQEPAAGKNQYRRLAENLWKELGTHPSAQTQALVESIQ